MLTASCLPPHTIHQNELDRVMLASLSTAVFDEILRDILCWIRDLQGACDAVAAALEEVAALRASLEDQEAGASDDSSLARAFWLSEQYERVAGRLRDLGRRLEPIEEAVAAFRSLETYVRDSQPSKAETEEQRDAILAAMFEALSQQGLEAHHPFGAWGNGAQGEVGLSTRGGEGKVAGMVVCLEAMYLVSRGCSFTLSIKNFHVQQGYGSDLRGLVDGLIDEAKRIPMYPAFEEETQEPEAVPAVEEAPLGALGYGGVWRMEIYIMQAAPARLLRRTSKSTLLHPLCSSVGVADSTRASADYAWGSIWQQGRVGRRS